VRVSRWPEAGGTVIQGILGRKLGMTRLFDETGAATATTIVEAGPCFVTQILTLDRDGYEAVQLGFEQVRDRKLNSPERGHLKASGTPSVKVLREVPVDDLDGISLGDQIKVDMLRQGERIDVVGTSKGASRASSSGTSSGVARRPTVSLTDGGRLARLARAPRQGES